MPDQTFPLAEGAMADLFTPSEAVHIVGDITPAGLVAAADPGDLPVAVKTPSGRRLFSRQALEIFKERRREREVRRATTPTPAHAAGVV